MSGKEVSQLILLQLFSTSGGLQTYFLLISLSDCIAYTDTYLGFQKTINRCKLAIFAKLISGLTCLFNLHYKVLQHNS